MRLLGWLLFAAAAIACSSSSSSTPSEPVPPGGDGGSSGTSGTSTSGGSSGTTEPSAFVTTTTETMQHEGAARKYILSIPVDYDAAKKYPLYFWLHGNPGTAENAASFAVDRVTKKEAIIVYPGSLDGGGWDHGASLADNVDSSFILAVRDALVAKYSIDDKRILLSGWSGGGFMSSAMACRFSAKFRAIGIHAGGAPYDPNSEDTPDCAGAAIATLVTHGTADGNVDFSGGEYAAQYWSEHNGCGTGKTASTPAPCQTYDGCPADKPVKFCFIQGQDHPLWDQALTVEWEWFKSLP